MLTIQDIEVGRTYVGGKYWQPKYETKLKLRLEGSYSDTSITLTDAQTNQIIAHIVELAGERLTLQHAEPCDPPMADAAPSREDFEDLHLAVRGELSDQVEI